MRQLANTTSSRSIRSRRPHGVLRQRAHRQAQQQPRGMQDMLPYTFNAARQLLDRREEARGEAHGPRKTPHSLGLTGGPKVAVALPVLDLICLVGVSI